MKKQIALFVIAVAALLLVLNGIFRSKGSSSGGAGTFGPIIAAMKDVKSIHLSGAVNAGAGFVAPMDLWAAANGGQTESSDLKLVVRLPSRNPDPRRSRQRQLRLPAVGEHGPEVARQEDGPGSVDGEQTLRVARNGRPGLEGGPR